MFQRKLDCGVTVVGEPLPNARSVSMGIWVGAGSVTEKPDENGISHFIEHMLFKGTMHRTAKQIAVDVDNIGANINAFTSKEATCYYIRVIDENLPEAVEILTDLFCNSTLPDNEMERERGVILEEIAMSFDQPDDVVMDLIGETYFDGSALAKTVLGKRSIIENLTRDDLVGYMGRLYTADNIVVAVAGHFDEDQVVDLLNEAMRNISTKQKEVPQSANVGGFRTKGGFALSIRDIEQVNMCFGFPAVSTSQLPERYALSVLSTIIGGAMSSRLFQRIREEMGLAYAIWSQPMLYKGAGMLCIYAGTLAKNAQNVTALILQEMQKVREGGVTRDEIEQSKKNFRGGCVLQMESTSARMMNLGRSWLNLGRLLSMNDILEYIENVTHEDVAEQIALATDPAEMSAAYVGTGQNERVLQEMVRSARQGNPGVTF